MKQVDLIYRTAYAELVQRSLDASFDADFPTTGNFVSVPVKGRKYWYFEDSHTVPKRRYVGPVDDAEINQRVAEFKRGKDDFRGRRKLVSTLTREAGLGAPERFTGDVIAALQRNGLFRLRAVLVGTVAFQAYSAHLGVRLPSASLQTGDADFAQFHSISAEIGDSLPPILDILRQVDDTFRPVPHMSDGRQSTQFINSQSYKVEFLTPNRGSADHDGEPSRMPALGGAAAQPLRFLDFLIYRPIHAVLLHGGGIPVLVPAPERFAVHKLIVSTRRRDDPNGFAKRDKDLHQASLLVEAMAETRRLSDLAEAYMEAWERGDHWQSALTGGLNGLGAARAEQITAALRAGLEELGEESDRYFRSPRS